MNEKITSCVPKNDKTIPSELDRMWDQVPQDTETIRYVLRPNAYGWIPEKRQ